MFTLADITIAVALIAVVARTMRAIESHINERLSQSLGSTLDNMVHQRQAAMTPSSTNIRVHGVYIAAHDGNTMAAATKSAFDRLLR